MFKKFLYGITAVLALFINQAKAQDSLHTSRPDCGFDYDYLKTLAITPGITPLGVTAPYLIPAAARDTCGSVILFYEDVALAISGGPVHGFAEGSGIGATRRNTMCAMVNYVQQTFDFSKIPSGKYLKLYISQSSVAIKVDNLIARGGPYYDTTRADGDTVNGYAWDLINTGIDYTDTNTYHGQIEINFDSVFSEFRKMASGVELNAAIPVSMNNGMGAVKNCEYDLFSCALHSMGHVLGFLTWRKGAHGLPHIEKYKSNYSLSIMIGPNPYSVYNPLDTSLLVQWEGNPDTGRSNSYWVNRKQSPLNYPVESYGKNHLAAYAQNYLPNNRISPGEINYYVMQYGMVEGWERRRFLKGDLETFHDIIGYDYTSGFASDSSVMLANKVAWSKKMSLEFNIPLGNPADFIQQITPDYTMVNNTGSSLVMNLASDTNLIDADGDILSVYPGSLHNITGCSIGSNNHAALSLSNVNRTITYTPRAGYFGRAQFGFNLWDGKEKGAYILYTIDVQKGNSSTYAIGDNLLMNGNSEEGEEVKTIANPSINNSAFFHTYYWYSRFFFRHRSDGLIYGSPTAVRNSWLECGFAPMSSFGSIETSFPWGTPGDSLQYVHLIAGPPFVATYPNSSAGFVGNRYITQNQPGVFQLTDTMRNCKRYTLEFDAFRTYLSVSDSVKPYAKEEILNLGFTTQSKLAPPDAINLMQKYPPVLIDSMKVGSWTHHKINFTYCADSLSTLMYLGFGNRNYKTAASMLLDNLVLKELPDTIQLRVSISDSAIGTCMSKLYVKNAVIGCPVSYRWGKTDGTLVSTDSSIDVNTTVVDTVVLEIMDGCGRIAYDTISLTPCPCMPGAVFGAVSYDTLTTASIPATLSAGAYYIPGDITIAATSTFSNAMFLIEPNVEITVNTGQKLTLENCHLLTCPDTNKLWKGIKLTSGAAIDVNSNTMIEDALVAINATAPSLTSGSWIIHTDGATFNRNRTAIAISNYSPSSPAVYPFKIVNTVFTSRKLNSFASYPSLWPSTVSLKTTFPNTTATAPYEINRNYERIFAKDKVPVLAGILLKDVGTLAGSTYAGIQIGGVNDTAELNLFDNTGDGIFATNTNLTTYNSTFINMDKIPPYAKVSGMPYATGSGINAGKGFHRQVKVSYIAGINVDLYNRFYDCLTCVRISDYSITDLYRNDFNSSNSNPDSNFRGIDITVVRYDSTLIKSNTLHNFPVGIYLYSNSASPAYSYGQTEIMNNTIQPQLLSPVIPAGTEFVLQGIESSASLMSTGATFTGLMLIKDNTLTDVYNGIKLSNYMHQKGIVMSNDVTLKNKNASSVQHGIHCVNNTEALVYGNNVSGVGAVATDFKKRAFYNVSNRWHVVDCNTARHTGRGFDFAGTQPRTFWRGNTMEDNLHGMALGGVIDQQGKPDYAILNEWQGTWSGGSGRYQSVCYDYCNPILSLWFVRYASSENPVIHYSLPSGLPPKYVNSTSILNTSLAYDDPCAPSITYLPRGYSSSPFMIAQKKGGLDYGGTHNAEQDWISQMGLWRLMQGSDSFHYHSNNEFADFASNAATARYGWLTSVEDALGSGDTNTAESLLASPMAAIGNLYIDSTLTITDSSAADYIVDNYIRFYELYLQYSKGQDVDSPGLAELCYKCPVLEGEVIHQARALYTYLYGIAEVYNDDSLCASHYPQMRRADPNAASESIQQDYDLYPNPNNGSFTIQQKKVENKSVNLKVYNAVGSLIYQSEGTFSKGQLKVHMGQQTQGVYLVCIADAACKTLCLRFVIK